MSLFDAGLEQAVAASGPLAVRLRPRTLDEVAGQHHLLAPGGPLRRLVEGGGSTSVLLWGPPGTGKTTLAHIVAAGPGRRFRELSAVTAGVKDVRGVIDEAKDALAMSQVRTVLFVDEVHRFNKAQQDALLPAVENGWVILVAATTENPFFSVISPLLSRSLLLTLEPLADDDVAALVERALADERGYRGRLAIAPEAQAHLVRLAAGDARRALTALEAGADAALAAAVGAAAATLDLVTLERAVDRAAVRYDRDGDQHYDVASAFIKSLRGSDVDASLHYLARMIEGGEDPRFIARRMIILASEDVGLAEPGALGVAVAAATALESVGLPEGRLALAQAAIHLALAPKSNAVIMAIDAAAADVRAGRTGAVPLHLRDSHYRGAGRIGHGAGYSYPHDAEAGVVHQQYAPDVVAGREYYQPSTHGFEARASDRLAQIRAALRGTPAAPPVAPPAAAGAARPAAPAAPPAAPGPGGAAGDDAPAARDAGEASPD
jgi:putative ATPase